MSWKVLKNVRDFVDVCLRHRRQELGLVEFALNDSYVKHSCEVVVRSVLFFDVKNSLCEMNPIDT